MDEILQNFTISFGPSTPFFHSLSLDSSTTMEELYRRTNSYSMLEDNIHAATQTVMIISHWLRATSQRGRSRLSPRNVIVETERDLVISHRKRGRSHSSPPPPPPPPPPPKHLIRGATAPHSRLARFHVACTDPDGSISEKPIRVVRLS